MAAMASTVLVGSTSNEGWDLKDITEENVQRAVIEKMRSLVEPFFTRLQLIRSGNPLEAVSMKPSGIWYANTYAEALDSLRDTPIPVNGKEVPARMVLDELRDSGKFISLAASSEFWEHIEDPSSPLGFVRVGLRMKEGVSPSEAYACLSERLSLLDCSTTISLAYTLTTIDILGKKRFDALANSMRPLIFGAPFEDAPSTPPFAHFIAQRAVTTPVRVDDAEPEGLVAGQTFYMKNIEDYEKKHRHGSDRGFSLLYAGDGKFLGLGLSPEGATLHQIGMELIAGYNRRTINESLILPAKMEKPQRMFTVSTRAGEGFMMTEKFLREVQTATSLPGMSSHALASLQRLATQVVEGIERETSEREARSVEEAVFFERPDLFLPLEMTYPVLVADRFSRFLASQ